MDSFSLVSYITRSAIIHSGTRTIYSLTRRESFFPCTLLSHSRFGFVSGEGYPQVSFVRGFFYQSLPDLVSDPVRLLGQDGMTIARWGVAGQRD